MESFCNDFIQHAIKIINSEIKEMILLTSEESMSYKKQKVCYICKKGFSTDKNNKNNLNYTIKSEIIIITRKFRGGAHSICNLRCKTPKKFQYYFIMVLHMIITS